MSWRDPEWRYTNAEATKKPNYLREKFQRIAREQKAAAERAEKSKPVQIATARKAK